MRLELKGFDGLRPRMDPRLLDENQARAAVDCDLSGGTLRPVALDLAVAKLARTGFVRTLHRWGAGGAARWCCWPGIVDVARGPIAEDSLEKTYFCDGLKPRVTAAGLVDTGGDGRYPESSHELGVPAPTAVPAASPTGSGGAGDRRAVVYCMTYVRTWADGTEDEGPPGPASNMADARNGETVIVGDLGGAVAGRPDISHKNIYRSLSGESGSRYRFVKRISVADGDTSEAVEDTDLGGVLETEDFDMPPDDLMGLALHPCGSFAGYSGKEICFSEPGRPWAWPVKYRAALDAEATGTAVFQSTVVAGTRGHPYLFSGSRPDAMSGDKLPDVQPCLSGRAMVGFESGVAYPSPNGLVVVGPGGAALATGGWLTRENWLALHPAGMHAAMHGGMYTAFFASEIRGGAEIGRGFVLDPGGSGPRLVDASFYAHALWTDPAQDDLYYVQHTPETRENHVMKYRGNDAGKRVMTYRSKIFDLGRAVNLGAARIEADWPEDAGGEREAALSAGAAEIQALFLAGADMRGGYGSRSMGSVGYGGSLLDFMLLKYEPPPGVTLRVLGENDAERAVIIRTRGGAFRLPRGFKDREACLEVSGNVEVKSVSVGTSVEEMR